MKDKVVVITGGGGVLCGSMAHAVAKQGARVAVLDLNKDAAEEVASQIRKEGGHASAYACNVLEKEDLESVRALIHTDLGTCDVLINGAGGNHPKGTTSSPYFDPKEVSDPELKTFFDLDATGIEFVFNLNFLGTLLPSQIFSRDMISKEDACIINVSSMNSFTPLTKIPAYSAAKAAVSNFTRWLAVHFSKVGIRVNALAPGFFLTEQNRALLTQSDGSPTPRGKQIIEHTPLGRYGEPEDLTSTLIWLCDARSSFVTGVIVPIDGGFSAFSGV